MIICISGLTGSGKSTIGSRLASVLNLKHIGNSYKSYTGNNSTLINFLKQKADSKLANDFDKQVAQEARKGNCVVTTWLGPWMVKNSTLNVWLYASDECRAQRKAKELRISKKAALEYMRKKDKLTAEHFKKVYGIDINDHSKFDVEINTEKMSVNETVSTIAYLSLEKEKKRFG